MADNRKCAHEGCTCTVGDGRKYCSDACANAADAAVMTIGCECGHPGCKSEINV